VRALIYLNLKAGCSICIDWDGVGLPFGGGSWRMVFMTDIFVEEYFIYWGEEESMMHLSLLQLVEGRFARNGL
jgi:hypothetical protein